MQSHNAHTHRVERQSNGGQMNLKMHHRNTSHQPTAPRNEAMQQHNTKKLANKLPMCGQRERETDLRQNEINCY